MPANKLDDYAAKTENNNHTPQEKIEGLHGILKTVKTGMLTTRSADGSLHSRAMAPTTPLSPTQVSLVFFANRVTHKFDEIENDAHVNVSFYDEKSTDWASFSGIAKITQDKTKIEKHWSPAISAWFGDLGDGVHKGDKNDPRIALIEVAPEEIRYFVATKNVASRAIDIAVSAVTSKTASPGEVRVITKQEIQLVEGLNTK